MKIRNFSCSQCGSTDFKEENRNRFRCVYCTSLYQTEDQDERNRPNITIKKGAHVVFGKNADVRMKGGMEIEGGAHVTILGKITIVTKGRDEQIEAARKKLNRM